MKNKTFKAIIIERFLTPNEQIEFEIKYEQSKIRALGRSVVKKLK
jgi:hypothetical protein